MDNQFYDEEASLWSDQENEEFGQEYERSWA